MVAPPPLLSIADYKSADGDHKPAVKKPHGIVTVHHLGFGNSTATCSCGWEGRRRRLKAAAEQDAWTHSILERCAVACPLVITW
jgi:hypothetical protein